MSEDYLKRPLILVIFGITGDLAQRYLLPALYNLSRIHQLPDDLKIVGVSRRDVSAKDVYKGMRQYLGESPDKFTLKALASVTEMVRMDLNEEADFVRLYDRLNQLDAAGAPAVRVYHLSVPPDAAMGIVRLLGRTGHNKSPRCECEDVRLLAEKPFGYDLRSAQELINTVSAYFNESQVYRIDHYLAKETVQNILTFRFENPLFEAVWDAQHIDHITVLAHEKIGIEGRVSFYENLGALRDFVQNHLLQLLALTTMQKPVQLSSPEIHAEKLKLLESIRPIQPDEVESRAVRAQYDGYLGEIGKAHSDTETYVQLALDIDNDRWRGVPIVLETGKALAARTTEIAVCFKGAVSEQEHNRLVLRLQPNEGITLLLRAKRPGLDAHTETVEMDFDYHRSFEERHAAAYERVVVDAIRGDQTLFASADEVLASWRVLEHVLAAWSQNRGKMLRYPQGSSGPAHSLNPHMHKM